jgi:hypothetical protein
LQYELSALKQDRELTNLRHEKELREIQKKAEADFKRAQVQFDQAVCKIMTTIPKNCHRLPTATDMLRQANMSLWSKSSRVYGNGRLAIRVRLKRSYIRCKIGMKP